MTTMRAGLIAIAAVALGIGLSACGSDTATEESASTTSEIATTTEAAPSSPPAGPAAGPKMTIADYVAENDIVQTTVLPGDPAAPTVTLPYARGWEDLEPLPEGAYDGMVFTAGPDTADPPTLIARMWKLTGDVDPAKVIEYAAGEMQNLPGFQGPDTGQPSSLAGFDATQTGGFYTRDGMTRMMAQKTVVIPAEDGIYVLQLTGDGTEDQAYPVMDATAVIDEQATIVP
ncbi:MAG: LpqN/LpqT family lipoprotein [Actinomycetota bacterium]|nr:LpqN/LpqT family lipoprotein [Actinomycetota bacterium]